MSYDVYKDAIMRVLPPAPEIPLDAPPPEGFDLRESMICPCCGGPDAMMQQVEDVEIARCPQCGCEFPPILESVSRQVIRRISDQRTKRNLRFMDSLPRTAPVAGLDPVDYDLFRKIEGEVESGVASKRKPQPDLPVPPTA